MQSLDELMKPLIKAVCEIEADLKNKEDTIINLRVRLKNVEILFGKTCFTCKNLKENPLEGCLRCKDHNRFKSMF